MIFKKEDQLEFYPEFLSIVVETNRKVYRNEMTGYQLSIILTLPSIQIIFCKVRMRIILTQLVDLKPYADPVTVFVIVRNPVE